MANNFAAFRRSEGTPFDPPAPTHSLVVELDTELSAALETHALACGINPSALVALWITPHLRDLRRPRPPSCGTHDRHRQGVELSGVRGHVFPERRRS